MNHLCTRNVLVGIAATIAVTACAGNDRRDESPRRGQAATLEQDLFRRAADDIKEAESGGAYEQASADLNRAREKFAAAQEAADEGEDETAERLAIEASLDAQVATATARNQEMQAALSALQESIRTLEDELRRNQQSDGRP